MDTTLTPAGGGLLRPLTTVRGGTTLLHHLLGLPLGIAYLVWFATALSLGAGLVITLIGIPILTLVLATVRPLLAAERTLANALLGTAIAPVPIALGGVGVFAQAKAYWTDRTTWRGLAYLLLRFPVGLTAFTVTVAAFGAAAVLFSAPFTAPLDDDAWEFGLWHVDTVLEGLALVPAGAVVLVAAGWISEGLGSASRGLARWGAR